VKTYRAGPTTQLNLELSLMLRSRVNCGTGCERRRVGGCEAGVEFRRRKRLRPRAWAFSIRIKFGDHPRGRDLTGGLLSFPLNAVSIGNNY
jgi:hypothetical protein